VTRVVHLITDEGPVGCADIVARLGRALPEVMVCLVPVPESDTLAAGFCLAELTLSDGPAAWMVVDGVVPAGDAGGAFCVGRSSAGVVAVAPGVGWSWSFAVRGLRSLCRLDVPASGTSHARLASAAVHAARAHPHAVSAVVARGDVPPLPECAAARALDALRFGQPAGSAGGRSMRTSV
jgi:hypothetical protein